ncbi:MAG: hypothetical protein GF400_04590 [Candidatus Eisenbacteria bacterium]|nr:hypothetical protein [Candidatus Eisenbacteria bacterium]
MGKHVVFWCVTTLLLAPAAATGQTDVTGNITGNTTWTVGGSPYVIQVSVVEVKNGSTLTIDPGVEIRFRKMTPKAQLRTAAGSSIVAVGTAADDIVFTSNAETQAAGDWGSVLVFASSGSQFAHCSFRYGYQALYYRECDSPIEPDVGRCSFDDCAIGMYIDTCSPTVHECWFREAQYNVLCRGSMSEPEFWHCNFLPAPGGPEGSNIRLQSYSAAATVLAQFCFWGSADAGEIEYTIYDSMDDGGLQGTVNYEPYLDETPVGNASWGRIKSLFRS